jgi:hypothetical protein
MGWKPGSYIYNLHFPLEKFQSSLENKNEKIKAIPKNELSRFLQQAGMQLSLSASHNFFFATLP